MLRVIFFDLDETLVAQETAFEKAYESTAAWLSRQVIDVEPKAFASKLPIAAEQAMSMSPLAAVIRRCCFGGRDILWGNPGNGAGVSQAITHHIDAFRTAVWDALLEDCSFASRSVSSQCLTTHLNHRFRAAMFAALCSYPDVRPALERLVCDYKLAVITNGMGAAQREKLVHLGLDRHFCSVIASAEIGVGKPAGQIFASAMRALDVRPDEALMIGDSLKGDIEGALSAGMHAMWLNRRGRPTSTRGAQISSLTDWSPQDTFPPSLTRVSRASP